MESFDEVVQELKDDERDFMMVDISETPVAINCSISGGMMIPNHPDCPAGDVPVLFVSFTFAETSEELAMVIPSDTALGHAILSGDLTQAARERLEKFL